MTSLLLTRTQRTPDGVFGTLAGTRGAATFTCCTMEDDWLDNAPGRSCIPDGRYELQRTVFYKHNVETFEVCGVPKRSRILIHVANTEEDVEGCIGLGLRFGRLLVFDEDAPGYDPVTRTGPVRRFKQAVVESQRAFAKFIEFMAGEDEADLLIAWAADLP